MQTPGSTTLKSRSPRVLRKDFPQFTNVVINFSSTSPAKAPLTTTTTTTSTTTTAGSGHIAEYRSESTRPIREAMIMGLAFFLVYTSFQAIQNLQSSLHERDGLGVVTLACAYGTGFLSSFATPVIIYHTGVKNAIMAAWVGHCFFVLCNFYPHWMTLIPGSLVMGMLSCPLWTSLEIYMTALARQEIADRKKQTTFHAVFSRLNGVFFSIFMAAQFSGNLISSSILFQSSYNQTEGNGDEFLGSEVETKRCGIHYCSTRVRPRKELARPDPGVVYTLMTVYLLFELCGLTVTALYLPDLQQPRWTGRDVWRKLMSHLEILTDPRLWLLVPFLVSRMMNLAIEVGTFTQAYISCTLGIKMVGYVMAAWGLATMLSAALLGWLARYTGRQVLCVSALACDAVLFSMLTWWEPTADQLGVFFFRAVLLGLVEGVWAVQVNALMATMFPNRVDSAFAIKGMFSSLSMAVTFIMANFLCPLTRIHVAICMIIIALGSYIVLELKQLKYV